MDTYVELLKYTLLFFLIWRAIRDRRDFGIALIAIALGGFYIGWEVTINERGNFNGSRLEGVGAPGADASNSLANMLLMMLPLASSLLVYGTGKAARKYKLLAACSAPLILNVILQCNSRGAFLGLISAGIAFLLFARGKTRKKALGALAIGSVALFLLLGDPKILDRFSTTFVGSAERDASAESRLDFWKSAGLMLMDYPLGAGGGSFKFNLGRKYQQKVIGDDATDRSIHNGYLTEATDWGVQGLFIKLVFILSAFFAAWRTMEKARKEERLNDAVMGLCLMSSFVGYTVCTVFGSYLANEWCYWLIALLWRYSQLYAKPAVAVGTATEADPNIRTAAA
jgi:O-antigen ligase